MDGWSDKLTIGNREDTIRKNREIMVKETVKRKRGNPVEKKEEKIKEYTDYCLNCKTKPCQKGCPLGNDIPAFIEKVKKGEIQEAYQILTQTTVLGGICGKICPHEKQCQGNCTRGIKGEPVCIGEIEAYVWDQVPNGHLCPFGDRLKREKDCCCRSWTSRDDMCCFSCTQWGRSLHL